MRIRAAIFVLVLLCQPVLAQEQEDISIEVMETADGAVLEEKIGVDGLLVSESYMLTRLTCRRGDKDVDLLMPFTPEDGEGTDGNTLVEKDGDWTVTLVADRRKHETKVTFIAIDDKVSLLSEGAQVSITHGSVLWQALVAPGSDRLTALVGAGQYVSVTDGPKLRQFERHCGLRR